MDLSKGAIDLLFYLAPAILVFVTAWYLIKKFLDTDQRLKMIELKSAMQKDLLPVRLQAYERIVLYLERISPNNLLVRVYSPGMSVAEFHREILSAIRSEYEHNITQQVYVTNHAWSIVRECRDELLKVINTSFENCSPSAPGVELSKKVFETILQNEESPIQTALDQIKNEVHSLF